MTAGDGETLPRPNAPAPAGDNPRLTAAIQQVAEAVLVTDVAGRIEYVNPAFEQVTGYTAAEALGKTPNLLKSGRHEAAFYRSLWSTIRGGNTWRGRVVNRRKDGSLYTADATISPVRGRSGQIASYVAVQRDISADIALESHARQAQKMDSIGRLAGGVAHDFNNILTVILGYTDLALRQLRDDHPAHAMIEAVRKAGESAAALTGQLLAFSRKQVLQLMPINLGEVVGRLEPMLERILGEDIQLVRTASDDGLTRADPGQMEQVIMNLAANARDAMPKGGRLNLDTARADLAPEDPARQPGMDPGCYVRLTVTDTGAGMDEATLARLFEPFFTTKVQRKGTGLGLAIVYGIVHQTGGHIAVQSKLGAGTTFQIWLPCTSDAAETPASSPGLPPDKTRGTATILVVDDADGPREVTRMMLEQGGHTVLDASDAEGALRAERQHAGEIHLLLTDVVMPGVSGGALARQILERRPAMRVLYMSGYPDDAIAQHGVLDPGVNFINKPFSSLELRAKVHDALRARDTGTASGAP